MKQLKGKEPGLPCGQQRPCSGPLSFISSELTTWGSLNVKLLFLAEVPGASARPLPVRHQELPHVPSSSGSLLSCREALEEAGSSGAPPFQGLWH